VLRDNAEQKRIEADLRAQASGFSRLTPEEEADLVARRADPRAAEKLVQHNLDLVVEQADHHSGRGMFFGDLYQEGSVGLIDAVHAYSGKGNFRQFASLHIGLQIDSLIEAEGAARSEDEKLLDEVKSMDMADVVFRRENKRDATAQELAEMLRWPVEKVEEVKRMLELARLENDVHTLAFLEDADLEEIQKAPEADPYRRHQGAGPDPDPEE
jgi:RNA polymerase sigma factor (sigma-70 family)